MKLNRSFIVSLVLLIIVAALYRVIPSRPWGFAPHIAMAIFGGAVIRDRKWAFALPVFSMFLSDALYQVLYVNGLSSIPGFYEGQVTNYLMFAGLTLVGFAIRKVSVANVALASLAAPVLYFLVSNFAVWVSGGGFNRPRTMSGLLQCYADGLPFFQGSLMATVFFSAVLFGAYYVVQQKQENKAIA
ncbi:hypothetical protein KJS94_01610 [Flavihumibacter rivuli]|uniref:DUF6580 family putative transport protein n=1 Tax=Flavihumibacter rivuli TaxID=2838156 RepID=UPI001BDE718A|nr:DUF6580 family putative transport protein [Flavihumibacter rivuli]ULQ56893.1 hypothetical protein KJS94_01610 [Flavihumibacter rivuli]